MDERMNQKSPEQKRIELEAYLLKYDGPDRVVSSIEMAEIFKNRPPLPKHKTGIFSLDQAIDGFEAGEVIVISGPTGHGKTLLCDAIMTNLRKESKFSLFFTFEVSPQKVILNHNTPDSVIFLPLEHKPMNVEWLRFRCLEAKLRYGCQAIFVDHLHYVVDLMTMHNMSLEIGGCMRKLKQLAIELNMPIFIVCHIGKIQLGKDLSLDSIRDSSFVGQEADTVLMVNRRFDKDALGKNLETLSQGLAQVKVEKARRTGNLGVKIKVKKQGNGLVESYGEVETKK